MNLLKSSLCLLVFLSLSFSLFAQRPDDHFMRRRVVNRLDLEEKINFPLVRQASLYDTDQSRFAYKKGISDALLSALKQGKCVAYHPDDLRRPLTWSEVEARMNTMDPYLSQGIAEWEEEETGLEAWDTDEWTDDLEEDFPGLSIPETSPTGFQQQADDFSSYEMVIQFVEDWIFDKNRSDLVYDIQFVEVIWVDPGGALPDKVLATFRWDEIGNILDQTQWPNRFNEAANLSVKDVFDLRIFHSFLVDVSGNGMRTLEEAEAWRKKMVEFEHNLYSY